MEVQTRQAPRLMQIREQVTYPSCLRFKSSVFHQYLPYPADLDPGLRSRMGWFNSIIGLQYARSEPVDSKPFGSRPSAKRGKRVRFLNRLVGSSCLACLFCGPNSLGYLCMMNPQAKQLAHIVCTYNLITIG